MTWRVFFVSRRRLLPGEVWPDARLYGGHKKSPIRGGGIGRKRRIGRIRPIGRIGGIGGKDRVVSCFGKVGGMKNAEGVLRHSKNWSMGGLASAATPGLYPFFIRSGGLIFPETLQTLTSCNLFLSLLHQVRGSNLTIPAMTHTIQPVSIPSSSGQGV